MFEPRDLSDGTENVIIFDTFASSVQFPKSVNPNYGVISLNVVKTT